MAVRWIQIDPTSADALESLPTLESSGTGEVVLVVQSPSLQERSDGAEAVVRLLRSWTGEDRRLFLLDLDLHTPRLHTVLGEPRGQGVADVILFGASMASVARQPQGEGFLFASAGVPVADSNDVLGSERWGSLLRAFRDAGVTLVLNAPLPGTDLVGVGSLADQGILFCDPDEDARALLADLPGHLTNPEGVGDDVLPGRGPGEQASADGEAQPVAAGLTSSSGVGSGDSPSVSKVPIRRRPAGVLTSEPGGASTGRRWILLSAGAVILVGLIWALSRGGFIQLPFLPDPGVDSQQAELSEVGAANTDPRSVEDPTPALVGSDSLGLAESGATESTANPEQGQVAPEESQPGPAVAEAPQTTPNPASSPAVRSLGYSLGLASYEGEADAVATAEDFGRRVPEVLFIVAPVEVNGRVFWRVLAGPVTTPAGAEALQLSLPPRLGYASGDAWVLHSTPLAFLLSDGVSREDAARIAEGARSRGVPAYLIEATEGGGGRDWRVYAGAYSSEEEAAVLGRRLAEIEGAIPSLVRRTGLLPR